MTVESGAVTAAAQSIPSDPPTPTRRSPEPHDVPRPDQPGLVQLLTPEGERIDHPDYPLDLSAADIRDMYRDLVLVRRIDTEAISLQRQGELGIWASLLGQEAAQIGSGRALGPDDMVFPTYREHGVAWCRGIDPVKLLELYRGVSHGGWDPEEHKFHLYTIVIGSQTLHATGYAMGIQRDGAVRDGGRGGEAVIVYFGDGATSQGDVNEAFVWASVFNAPVVFFCQNNQWAISEPLEKQSRIPLYQRARGFGFPGLRVDGNDVLACYAVTKKALQAAREGQGPTLIEAFTYRMGAHTTTDDPTRYRLASELEVWKLKDPIERVRAYLVRTGQAEPEFFAAVDAEAKQVGARVREACRTMADPPPLTIFDNVYAEPSPDLDPAGRARAVRRLPGFLRGGRAMTTLTLSKALNAGLRKAMENDPKVLIMGEDVGKLGGVFRVTDGLHKDFGEDRVIDTPLAESGIVGTAIGLALRGYRPVCEIQFDGFVYPAANQIVSQLAKMRYRSRGYVSLPVTIRIPCGGGIGAVEHHSESPEVLFAHTAGLRVVACADAADAFAMIQQSISCDDPVIFFEPKRRYWDKAEVDTASGVAHALPLDRARVVLQGTDVTLLGLRPAGPDLPGVRARGPPGRPQHRGHRPALAVPAGHGDDQRLGPPHRPLRGRARGAGVRRPRRRDRRPGDRAVLLPAGGAGAAGRRLRHPLPAVPARGPLPARPGPDPGRRRPRVRLLRGR